jgi:hypothetical protein
VCSSPWLFASVRPLYMARGRPNPRSRNAPVCSSPWLFASVRPLYMARGRPNPRSRNAPVCSSPWLFASVRPLYMARGRPNPRSRNAPAPTRAARLTHENVIRRSEARRTRALPRWRRRATARGDAFTVQNGSICIKKVELGSFTGLWRTPTEPTSNPTPRTSVTRGRAPVCGPSRKRKRFNGCIGS